MLYTEYEEYKSRYIEAQRNYNKILSEKEQLFAMTQPQSIDYSKDHITGGIMQNCFDSYLIGKDERRIDERLVEARSLLDGREHLLHLKEKELRNSNDTYDRIYTMRYIEHYRVYLIARRLRYSQSQVYRIIEKIKQRCDEMRTNQGYNTKAETAQ